MSHFLILTIVFGFILSTVDSRQCPDRASIEQSLLDGHIPGAVVLVVNQTDILYQQAFGYQSFSPEQSTDVDKSVFLLASISKTMIAVSVMQLVESKQLDLDTDINKYLRSTDPKIVHPHYPSHVITLRQLLSHSASIGHNFELENHFFRPNDEALTLTALENACFHFLTSNASHWLRNPPGTVTLYSNVGTSLAALIVERVANLPFAKYVKRKILDPLGINSSVASYCLSDIKPRENIVNHYTFNSSKQTDWEHRTPGLNITEINDKPGWLRIPFYSVTVYPAGLLRMSAPALSIFLRMFMKNDGSFLRRESIEQMKTIVTGVTPYETTNPSPFPPPSFGIIWFWQKAENGREYLGHGGSMPSVYNSMLINKQGDRGFIFLTNGDTYPDNNISLDVHINFSKIRSIFLECFDNN